MTTDSFRFVGYPVRVGAGHDAIAKLADGVDRLRSRRLLVVCGRSVADKTDLVDRLKDALGGRVARVFSGGGTGSPLTSVMEWVPAAREVDADGIVTVGCGSAMVTARGIPILLAEKGTAQEFCTQYPEGKPPVSPRLMPPKILNFIVLTTATTVVTRAGAALIHPKTRPAAVIWDDQALLTAPPWLCLNATASCFTGVASGLQSTGRNPLAESDLLEALLLLLNNLPLVDSTPGDPAVRINLCAAAFLYNRATDAGAEGSALGVVTALAHSLDTRYRECGHGDAYTILTPPGMGFDADSNAAGQASFAHAVGVKQDGMDDKQAAAAAADAIEELFESLRLPTRLR